MTAPYSYARGMSDGEILTRAREAYIFVSRPNRWAAKRIRAGKYDRHLTVTLVALRDIDRSLALIVADRDEATAAIALKTTSGLAELTSAQRRSVAEAIHTAVRLAKGI